LRKPDVPLGHATRVVAGQPQIDAASEQIDLARVRQVLHRMIVVAEDSQRCGTTKPRLSVPIPDRRGWSIAQSRARSDQGSMMLSAILIVLAASASFALAPEAASASLGVTATVVRPVEIVPPSIRADSAVVTIRNTIGVEVRVTGAIADMRNPDSIVLTSDRPGPVEITIIY